MVYLEEYCNLDYLERIDVEKCGKDYLRRIDVDTCGKGIV
jgi:hypothetical protein